MPVTVFVIVSMTANVTAAKLVGPFGLVLPAAVVLPVSHVCGDPRPAPRPPYGRVHSRRANALWLWMLSWFTACTRNHATRASSRSLAAALRTMSSTKTGLS